MQGIYETGPGERADRLPDGRYLLTNIGGPTKVISADGSIIEPAASEAIALKALTRMSFRRVPCWRDIDTD